MTLLRWLRQYRQVIAGVALVLVSIGLGVIGGDIGLCLSPIVSLLGGWLIGSYDSDRE